MMTRTRWIGLAAGASAALTALAVFAQSGGGFVFQEHAIPGGGGKSAAAGYEIVGAIGQPFAGKVQGSGFVMQGGILSGGFAEPTFELYTPGLAKDR